MDSAEFEKMVQREWDKLQVVDDHNTWLRLYKEKAYDFTQYRKKRFEELNQDETPRV